MFTDWCAATGHPDLPADPDTILQFLSDCPASRSTQRCRVAAIDHHHTAAGVITPGDSTVVRAALGRPAADRAASRGMTEQVAAALRGLPSHGWTQGMFGRRDRCLLVLSQLAGAPYTHLGTLTAGDISLIEGTVSMRSAAGPWALLPGDTALLWGPCAVTRWLRVVDLAVTKITAGTVAAAVDKANPVTLVVPVFSSINQWGALPFPLHRLTPHSLSRRARDLLAGNLGAHRHLPVDTTDTIEPVTPAGPVVKRTVYSKADHQRAWARRRADLTDVAGVEDLLKEVDARAKDLEMRTATILLEHSGHHGPGLKNE